MVVKFVIFTLDGNISKFHLAPLLLLVSSVCATKPHRDAERRTLC